MQRNIILKFKDFDSQTENLSVKSIFNSKPLNKNCNIKQKMQPQKLISTNLLKPCGGLTL